MTVPAKRRSSSRVRRGRAHLALTVRRLIKCPQCGKPTLPHQVCPLCGYYKGRAVVALKMPKKKAKS